MNWVFLNSLRFVFAVLILALPANADKDKILDDTLQSHITANVPPSKNFNLILSRDLKSYFSGKFRKLTRVDYELLRNTPTQSGVSYPKYYAWIHIYNNNSLLQEGAVRLQAIGKTNFEITHFLEKSYIQKKLNVIKEVFPASLCGIILDKANGNK